ncbi:hypothetical protein [Streptomyces sp. NPDC059262]|uniref:hypothetical protein n=1 Tax=Streptomyces sp. NPDC059262 TaxID=3346797 RepID=UPI003682CBB5
MGIVLVADPGVASEIAHELADKLPQQLRRRVRADIDWQVTARTAPLVADEQLDVSSAVDVVRPFLPEGDWDAAVFLTDLPRRAGRFIVPGLHGHLSLVTGMVRANRPWRLFANLSRALAGVFATAAFGLVNTSAWTISSDMDAVA